MSATSSQPGTGITTFATALLMQAADTTTLQTGELILAQDTGVFYFTVQLYGATSNDLTSDDGLGLFRVSNVPFIAVDDDSVLSALNVAASSIDDDSIKNIKINSAAAIDYSKLGALTDANILVGDGSNVATVVAMSGDVAIANTGATTIQAASIDLAMLSAGITPSHVVKFTEKVTWSGAGASLAHTITGVVAGDFVQCTIDTVPSEAAYLVSAAPTTNTVTVVLSAANTSNDAVVTISVLSAAS